MLNLKEWLKWFEKRGYNAKLSKDGSELFIPLRTCNIHLQADGVAFVTGCIEVETKEGLWRLINNIGVLQ
jgi:hypothetical protein